MTSSQKNHYRSFLFFLILSLLVLVADRTGLLKQGRSFLEAKLVIPGRILIKSGAGQSCPPNGLDPGKEKEITSLKTQIAALKSENLSARKLLGAPLPSDWRFTPARVIGGSQDEILIDKGKEDGVVKGMTVLAEGLYLGEVVEPSQRIAKVKLLSLIGAKAVVKIVGQESLTLTGKGLLQGKGEGKMEVRQILAKEGAEEGDLVVISRQEIDLPVGKVVSVSYLKGEVFKSVEVEREIKIRNLETVFLVTGKI